MITINDKYIRIDVLNKISCDDQTFIKADITQGKIIALAVVQNDT